MNSVRLLLLRNKLKSVVTVQQFSTSCVNYTFWEKDRKGGYNKDVPQLSFAQHVKQGWKALKEELKMFKEEVREHFEADIVLGIKPGVVDKYWELRTPKSIEQWQTSCDSDHGEGFTTCSFKLNKLNYGEFSGVLDTTVPKTGIIKRAGYASIRSLRKRKSFQRDGFIDWSQYTHLVLKVRGDGRSYMINLATVGFYDQLWNDMYQYVLYTRGGPYWQITRIPFSKFFFSSKGRIQDIQDPIPLDRITHLGITAADKVNGPFCLEIDYIGCEYDPNHKEEFAYEMYETPRNLAAN